MASPAKRKRADAASTSSSADSEEAGAAASSSWQAKCIEDFQLKPVPDAWKHEVDGASEAKWMRYYHYRKKQEKIFLEEHGAEDYDSEDDEDDYCDDGGIRVLLRSWNLKLELQVERIFGLSADASESEWKRHWQATMSASCLRWEDEESLTTATFESHVWSPYAIPHAVELEQNYHCRPRYSSVEFHVNWKYRLVDFTNRKNEWQELCSNCYEDEELRKDVITTDNLTKETVDELREFLYGTQNYKALDEQVCNGFDFMTLLFASTGTFNYITVKCGDVGYSWDPPVYQFDRETFERGPNMEFCNALLEAHVIDNLDDVGKLSRISWLEYSLRKATGHLRPIDQFYRQPTVRDAVGFNSDEEDEEEEEGEDYDDEEDYMY